MRGLPLCFHQKCLLGVPAETWGIMDLLTGLLALKHIAKLDGDRPHSYFFLRTQPFSSRFHLHINASRFLL